MMTNSVVMLISRHYKGGKEEEEENEHSNYWVQPGSVGTGGPGFCHLAATNGGGRVLL